MQVVDDRYEILEVIASGGMATVYRAVDLRLDRPVALKRPHPGPPDNDSDGRMEREARAASGLNHPNVVTVYDYGRDELGPFLVMELVDGVTLREKGDVSAEEAIQIGAQLADGLAAIHAAGVVHRDVKPANVIMSERGPMLTDFGIAYLDEATEQLTDPGTVLATPSYAAPEVLSGHPPTPASDVYSLALVVSNLVEGVQDEIDPGLLSILERSLSDSPEERPDAATLAASLRDGVPTMAMAPISASGSSAGPTEPTLILEADPTPPDRGRVEPTTRGDRSWWPIALLLALLALGSIWALLAFADDDAGEDATLATDSTLMSPTSTLVTTTTSPPVTAAQVEEDPAISEAIAGLEAILLEPPRSDYNREDAESIIGQIRDAIATARSGETEVADETLNALARDFAQRLDSKQRDDAIALLETIADSVGVEIDDDLDDD